MLGVVFDEDENFVENWTTDTKNRGFRLFYRQNPCESNNNDDPPVGIVGHPKCREPDGIEGDVIVEECTKKTCTGNAVSTILHHSHPYFIYEVIMKHI